MKKNDKTLKEMGNTPTHTYWKNQKERKVRKKYLNKQWLKPSKFIENINLYIQEDQ